MARRMALVAVSRWSASVSSRFRALRAFVISAYESAGGLFGVAAVSGAPHSPQNFIVGAFSCWQAGHCMPAPPLLKRGQGSTDKWALWGGPPRVPIREPAWASERVPRLPKSLCTGVTRPSGGGPRTLADGAGGPE